MSTFRLFGARVLRVVEYGLKRLLGRPQLSLKIARSVPSAFRILSKRPLPVRLPIGIFTRQVWRAVRGGGYSHLRAASMGLWRRRLTGRPSVHLGLAGALAWVKAHESVSNLQKIQEMFRNESCSDDPKLAGRKYPRSVSGYEFGSFIATGCNAAVYEAKLSQATASRRSLVSQTNTTGLEGSPLKDPFPLAVKMMFNYHLESSEECILRGMSRELVPVTDSGVQLLLRSDRPMDETHPNIVQIHTAFVDGIPPLRDAELLFPQALPPEIFAEGYGRSQTLFLVMERYSMTLREYLLQYEMPARGGLVLFGQLLEALVFLAEQRVSHRDLKSNNILVDFHRPGEIPHLVLSDFGTCLSKGSMTLPFVHEDMDLGGNVQLRPPEVRCARPGPFRSVDFSKADLWGAGTLAYEIFTKINPFYRQMRSDVYAEEDLPELPASVPKCIRELVFKILRRDPRKRPSVHSCADVTALSLFRAEDFVGLLRDRLGVRLDSGSRELWLRLSEALGLYAAETLLLSSDIGVSPAELLLRQTFLSRLDSSDLWAAVPFFLEESPGPQQRVVGLEDEV